MSILCWHGSWVQSTMLSALGYTSVSLCWFRLSARFIFHIGKWTSCSMWFGVASWDSTFISMALEWAVYCTYIFCLSPMVTKGWGRLPFLHLWELLYSLPVWCHNAHRDCFLYCHCLESVQVTAVFLIFSPSQQCHCCWFFQSVSCSHTWQKQFHLLRLQHKLCFDLDPGLFFSPAPYPFLYVKNNSPIQSSCLLPATWLFSSH